ncbi:sulfite exporter TauE/SafE family protein [Nonomuraea sp. NPDC049158]|uniref:sulfite exporter TauE/SafE family protein n=1 Tax=Nonomuraea sp. NPDC049158 TaxID=3155649 RepID=UPI0033F92458
MIVGEVLGLLGAGVAAGVVSTVVSLASIVSYPALLAFGLPPLTANVTNTVALMFTSVGAAVGSRPELAGQGGRVLRLGWVTALGGATGALLLLVTPARAFELIAPWLIAGASLLLVRRPTVRPGGEHGLLLRVALFVVSIYVGYFGAAGGILMFAVLAGFLDQSPARLNAAKNMLSGLANAVAGLGFALFGPVDWGAAVPLAAGFLLGGWLGPKIVRRMPGQSLRYVAAACGVAVAIKLGWDSYVG